MEGNLLVDGILASCYASSDHGLAHMVMAPIRWFPNIIGDYNKSPSYINIAKELNRWVVPQK